MYADCETCGRAHDDKYGSGSYCSSSCARSAEGLAFRRKRALITAREKTRTVMSLKFILNPEIDDSSRILAQ